MLPISFNRGTWGAGSLGGSGHQEVLDVCRKFYLRSRCQADPSIDGAVRSSPKLHLESRRTQDPLPLHPLLSAGICRTRGQSTDSGNTFSFKIQVTLSQSKYNFKLKSKSIRLTHFLCDYFVNNVLFVSKPFKDLLVILFFGQLVELPFYCYKLLRQ